MAFLITGEDATQTEIPESGYSFSVLKRAQALGDYETLEAHGRRVIRIHITGNDQAERIEQLLTPDAANS
jgi:transaldolase/glucose-6-phosphate isomerase